MKTKHHSILSARSGHSSGKTLYNTVHRRLFALGLPGILFIAFCALVPPSAQAQCQRWDVSSLSELRAGNGGDLTVKLQQGAWQQQSANITGAGTYKETNSSGRGFAGSISGNITGNSITIQFNVMTDTLQYVGTVRSSGMIDGTCWFESRPEAKVRWIGSIKCADANPPIAEQKTRAASPTPSAEADKSSSTPTLVADPQTVQIPAGQEYAFIMMSWDMGKSGRFVLRKKVNDAAEKDELMIGGRAGSSAEVVVEPGTNVFTVYEAGQRLATVTVTGRALSAIPDEGGGVKPSAPPDTEVNDPNASRPVGAPRITASPTNATGGSTTLTWDGGPEHPYAEVWVKVDNNDEKFVVEKGKGSRQVQVTPGKTYLYILTDAGKRLATVTVRAQGFGSEWPREEPKKHKKKQKHGHHHDDENQRND